MESIVSPWIIYLLFKVDSVRELLGGSTIVVGIAAGVLLFIDTMDNDGDWIKEHTKTVKKSVLMWIFIVVFVLLTPSKNTIVAMYAANEITYDRAGQVVDITKDIKNSLKRDIIDIIQEVSKPEKADK